MTTSAPHNDTAALDAARMRAFEKKVVDILNDV